MAVEIERKFLVTSDAWREGASVTPIWQGYIFATPEKSVRVRTKGDLGFITIKSRRSGSGTNEFEYEIPVSDAKEILDAACEHPIIEKLRFERQDHGHRWEIDVFKAANAGLIVAEVELESANEPVELPDWVGEEVTSDPRYLNASLYQNPFQNWAKP
jgi:CYTH domain-containing protein